MKFNEFPYTRPDFEAYKQSFNETLKSFSNALDAAEQRSYFRKINELRQAVDSMSTLASIRHSIDTNDAFYKEENDYWDEYKPLYAELDSTFYKAVLSSPYLEDFKDWVPEPFFKIAANALKAFDPAIIEELQEENRLVSSYYQLIASAQIELDGKTYTLSQLTPLTQAPDRALRKRAFEARTKFLAENEVAIDTIYDELVQLRTKIAQKLGFDNYIPLGYLRMNRLDYNQDMVAGYRDSVLKNVVPFTQELYQKQAKRIDVDKLAYYDIAYEFKSGNPVPKEDMETMVKAAQGMYKELSPETDAFFSFMQTHELMDLASKKGKQGGGYCTYISDHKAPFIFANFNETAHDVEVLTHEAGHAFQVFQSRWIDVPECQWPTLESCEIHSMSMEYLTWPWMDRFFKKDTAKFKYAHLADALKFLPYGVSVDHFQHEVYAHPEYSPKDRKDAWRRLEKMYTPHKDYSENAFYDQGTFWFTQSHIFANPFYYIDYTLAGVCALQFWKRSQENDPNAFKDYLNICNAGGTLSFLNIVKEANLKSPFDPTCIPEVMVSVKDYLSKVDDQAL